ncbi:hypothetical protein RvY_08610 [Ramazzottius varieornatus]|uniref:Uncharacterized protein n=1 Tax=Ramazzottius varieornatus TaxID=947166 RepID=A0A1D1VC27_RAMVA|nr:hypothetical protein RvY_08610 [Ramazzottius varieornatus]
MDMSSFAWLSLLLAEFSRWTSAGDLRVQCYLPEWTLSNEGNNPFRISDIAPTKACDVIIYAFFKIEDGVPAPTNGSKYRQHFAQLNDLKEAQPDLEILLGVGGWGSGKEFASTSSNPASRIKFASAVVTTLRRWSLDGVNIDWQFPEPAGARDHALLLQSLREAFELEANKTQRERLKLTTTVTQTVRLGYLPKEIAKYVDGVNVLTYDYKGNWGSTVQKTAVNAGFPDVRKSVTDWINAGITPAELSLGIPFYGRTWTLTNDTGNTTRDVGMGHEAIGPGVGGFLTYDNGTLSYTEICINLKTGWTRKTDPASSTSYAYSGNQWVSYDDDDSISIKVKWAESQNMKGVFIWHIGLDDRQGACGPKFPLLAAIRKAISPSTKAMSKTPNPTFDIPVPSTRPSPPSSASYNPVHTSSSLGRNEPSKAILIGFLFAFVNLIC